MLVPGQRAGPPACSPPAVPMSSPSHPAALDEDLSGLLPAVVTAAVDAGAVIQQCRGDGSATQKLDGSVLTAADRAADTLLKARLLGLRPVGWLSEETADSPNRLTARELWIVDPLDGTKEFVQGLPEYTVAIALVRDGRPVLGVVHNPATGDTWSAMRGAGACDGTGRRLSVAAGRGLLASRTEIRLGEFEPFAADWDVQPLGSIQYKLARIADGSAALTFSRGPKHEWDVCAGALLIEEAGGLVPDLFGEPLRYNQSFPKHPGVLAGHPESVAAARGLIAALGGSERMRELDARSSPLTPQASRQSLLPITCRTLGASLETSPWMRTNAWPWR